MDPTQNPIEDRLVALEAVQAPASLRAAVQAAADEAAHSAARRRVRWPLPSLRPRSLALAGGSLAALVVALVLALGGGAGAPTVADAAQAALLPVTGPAPHVRAGGHMLTSSVDGVVFPSWRHIRWHAVGEREDTLAGRRVHTVVYANAGGARVGYAIAAGDPLPLPTARVVHRRGIAIRVLALHRAAVVTWERGGHTCVLAARGVDAEWLVKLASYTS